MNKEEIIDILKNKLFFDEYEYGISCNDGFCENGLDAKIKAEQAIKGLLNLYNKQEKMIDLMADKIVEFTFDVQDIKSSFKEQIIKFFEKEVEKNE